MGSTESINQRPENFVFRCMSYVRFPFTYVLSVLNLMFWSVLMAIFTFINARPIVNLIIFLWGRTSYIFAGVRVQISGEENLPEGGCLILFNHSSHYDIPIMYGTIRKHYRYGAKAELFKVPFLGLALRRMGALPIHRGKREEVLRLYENSVERIERGESFALAPEGTRQNQPELGRFKTGPFIFAVKAKAPIVPVVIKGALEILPKGTLIVNAGRWRRDVVVRILPPIDPKSCDYDIEVLKDKTKEIMSAAYSEM